MTMRFALLVVAVLVAGCGGEPPAQQEACWKPHLRFECGDGCRGALYEGAPVVVVEAQMW